MGSGEAEGVGSYTGTNKLKWWIDEGQHREKARSGARALVRESGIALEPWRVCEAEAHSRGSATDEVWIDRSGRILVDGASGPLLEALRALEGEMRLDAVVGEGGIR